MVWCGSTVSTPIHNSPNVVSIPLSPTGPLTSAYSQPPMAPSPGLPFVIIQSHRNASCFSCIVSPSKLANWKRNHQHAHRWVDRQHTTSSDAGCSAAGAAAAGAAGSSTRHLVTDSTEIGCKSIRLSATHAITQTVYRYRTVVRTGKSEHG